MNCGPHDYTAASTQGYSDLGQVAYEAYGAAVDWTAYDGGPIASWDRMSPIRRHAWGKAAERVGESVNATAAAVFLEMLPAHRRAAALSAVAEHIGVDLAALSPAAVLASTETPQAAAEQGPVADVCSPGDCPAQCAESCT